jgi:hypothetical protein
MVITVIIPYLILLALEHLRAVLLLQVEVVVEQIAPEFQRRALLAVLEGVVQHVEILGVQLEVALEFQVKETLEDKAVQMVQILALVEAAEAQEL